MRAVLLSVALAAGVALPLLLALTSGARAVPAPAVLGMDEIDKAVQKMVVNGYRIEVGQRGVRLLHAAAGEIYAAEQQPLHLALHNCVVRAQQRDAEWKKFLDDQDAARGVRNR